MYDASRRYTSMVHANKEKRHLPVNDLQTVSIAATKCRSVIDNMLAKPVILGLVFNSDSRNPVFVMKDIMQMSMLVDD